MGQKGVLEEQLKIWESWTMTICQRQRPGTSASVLHILTLQGCNSSRLWQLARLKTSWQPQNGARGTSFLFSPDGRGVTIRRRSRARIGNSSSQDTMRSRPFPSIFFCLTFLHGVFSGRTMWSRPFPSIHLVLLLSSPRCFSLGGHAGDQATINKMKAFCPLQNIAVQKFYCK